MTIIDTHVHYNLEPLYSGTIPQHFKDDIKLKSKNWKDHWKKAQKHGVSKSIVVGADVLSSHIASDIAEDDDALYATIGIHPHEFDEIFEEQVAADLAEFDSLIANTTSIVAIGEVGLDYYHLPSGGNRRKKIIEAQKFGFEQQIQLAKKHKLPLIIHVRDKDMPEKQEQGNAYWDTLEIVRSKKIENIIPLVFHCISGPLSYIQAIVELGGYVGFAANITYKNAEHMRDIFQHVPDNRRLVETDAPYLPPQQYRGSVCEPWMIEKTVQFMKKEFSIDPHQLVTNAERVFGG